MRLADRGDQRREVLGGMGERAHGHPP
jgi:hypothetical protein